MQSLCLRPAGSGEVRAALKPAKALRKLSALAGSSWGVLYGAGQKQMQRCAIHQVISSPECKLEPRIPSSRLNSSEWQDCFKQVKGGSLLSFDKCTSGLERCKIITVFAWRASRCIPLFSRLRRLFCASKGSANVSFQQTSLALGRIHWTWLVYVKDLPMQKDVWQRIQKRLQGSCVKCQKGQPGFGYDWKDVRCR